MGLMLDIQTIRRTGTRALGIAVSGTVIPFVLGATLFFLIVSDRSKVYGCLFWGFALTVSGFNALTQILEKQSVIHTEIGKLSIASAQASEIISWGLLGVGLAVANSAASSVYAIGLAILFVFICLHGIRRALVWIIKQTPEGQGYSEFYLCFILSGVALCGVVTDAIGTHPMLGAFLFGLIIPNEELQTTLVERLEDFVMAIFMPGFFAVCGIRTNLDSLTNNGTSWVMVAFLIFLLSGSKIISAVFASYFTNISVREATTIGLLTSTKSILALIIVEVAQEHGVFSFTLPNQFHLTPLIF